jgi:hypothetical protein
MNQERFFVPPMDDMVRGDDDACATAKASLRVAGHRVSHVMTLFYLEDLAQESDEPNQWLNTTSQGRLFRTWTDIWSSLYSLIFTRVVFLRQNKSQLLNMNSQRAQIWSITSYLSTNN